MVTGSNPVKRALKPLVPYRVRVWTRNMQTNVANRNLVSAPPMSPAVQHALLEGYRADIARLERITDRDLSHWFTERSAP